MQNTKEAISNIKKLGKSLQGLIDFANELENLASLENHVSELAHAKETLILDVSKLSVSLKDLNADFEAKLAKGEAALKLQEEEAANIILVAKGKAEEIAKLAKAEHEKCYAHIKLLGIESDKAVQQKKDEVAKLDQLVEKAEARLKVIQSEVERIKSL